MLDHFSIEFLLLSYQTHKHVLYARMGTVPSLVRKDVISDQIQTIFYSFLSVLIFGTFITRVRISRSFALCK